MRYASFDRTGLAVSCLRLGTETFGHQADKAESFRILDRLGRPA